MLREAYGPGGMRSFDAGFMAGIYQKDFEVIKRGKLPDAFEIQKTVGRHFEGCRIGLDVGGSDYKVSAVIDGETVWQRDGMASQDQRRSRVSFRRIGGRA